MNDSEQKLINEKLLDTLEKAEKRLAALEAQAKRRRISGIIACLIIIAVLVVGAYFAAPVISDVADTCSQASVVADTLLDALKDVDLEQLSANIQVFANADTEKLQGFVNFVSKVDFESLSEQLDAFSALGEKLEGFNFDVFEGASEALQNIIGPLKEIFGA